MSLIVTHPGKTAHRDDFIASCLMLAYSPSSTRLVRKDPTPEDLADADTIVIDVGRQHDPELKNFDHHQLPKGAEPTCSITLVMEHLGFDLQVAREIWPWLEFSEWMDSKGPRATQAHFGMTSDHTLVTQSPIEGQLLHLFGQAYALSPHSTLLMLMKGIGEQMVDYYQQVTDRLQALENGLVDITPVRGGVKVCDLTSIPVPDNPTLGLEIFLQKHHPDCAVTISLDDRGPGLSLYRRNDDKRIDFKKIEDEPNVSYVHANGFLAKTTDQGRDFWYLINLSLTLPDKGEKQVAEIPLEAALDFDPEWDRG